MKIYIAYKLSGSDLSNLKLKLEYISSILENLGHETFIFLRDIQNWTPGSMNPTEIMELAMKEMHTCDAIISIIENKEKGEGLLIENGFMKALGKKIIVLFGPDAKSVLLNGIAEDILTYTNLNELEKKLRFLLK